MIFQINNDTTSFVLVGQGAPSAFILGESYDLNNGDVYDKWTDANGLEHRNIYRSKIEGSFDFGIITEESFAAFITAMNSYKNSGGYYSVTATVLNCDTAKNFNAFLTYTPKKRTDRHGDGNTYTMTIKVVEV